jgi:phage tail tape-measure protein
MPFRRFRPEEFEPSDEELADARTSQSAQGTDSAIGSGVGGLVGTLAGLAPLLIPGVGAAIAPITAPMGGQIGSSVGSAIGGQIGGHDAEQADERLRKAEEERKKKLTALQMREQALNDFIGGG